ncbi:hypothetical protein NSMS1_28000 [Nostoc sp. MS1]|nr:hypothetical protein NSMS1_28000 [Nostoc sp. MS1]
MDNDFDSCVLLMVLFAEYGVKTTTAICATQALDIIQQAPPDLLISEIMLPDDDGYSFIRKVKAWEKTYGVEIPAIALTVCVKESDRLHALAAGFCRYLVKPINVDELIATIAHITGQGMSAKACC